MKKRLGILFVLIFLGIGGYAQGYFWGMGGYIYRIDPEGENFTTRIKVNYGSEFLLASNGKLYATTSEGGVYNYGTLIEFDPNTEVVTKKADFNVNQTGGNPSEKLFQASNGKIYGVAGSMQDGVLFEFDIEKNTLTNVADFSSNWTGSVPFYGGLTEINGKLYGAAWGGQNGVGTIFEYNLATTELVAKRHFSQSAHGALPNGKLWLGKNNKLYGITYEGGANNQGTIFEYNPADNALLKKVDFANAQTGAYCFFCFASLTLANNGKFYSANHTGGANGSGVIFGFDPATGTFTKEFDFGGNSGINGSSILALSPNGKLYGMSSGGAFSQGVTFEFDPATRTAVKKGDLSKVVGGLNLTFVPSSKTNQLAQIITFENIPQKYFGDSNFVLTATSTSGLPVAFTSSDPSIISITNNVATILKAGTVTLYAKQSGNDVFSSEEAEQTLEIIKATPIVTWPTPADISFGTPLSSDQLNATSSVAGVFTYTPPAGTILNLGNSQNLSLTFTPANANGY
ncbi:MAG: choice-of-anchor tandem repeat GloVer-containing protein, partial [Flammeovirgaceae bacterium]